MPTGFDKSGPRRGVGLPSDGEPAGSLEGLHHRDGPVTKLTWFIGGHQAHPGEALVQFADPRASGAVVQQFDGQRNLEIRSDFLQQRTLGFGAN